MMNEPMEPIEPKDGEFEAWLSEQVSLREKNRKSLLWLAGMILATLRININRGTMHCDTYVQTAEFEKLLLSWESQYAELGKLDDETK
jgi:hypothetical protein